LHEFVLWFDKLTTRLGRPGLFRIAWYTSSTVVEMKRLLTVEAVANYTWFGKLTTGFKV
jgi:hypothetical protein